jgi:hypothetical protein
MCSFELDFPGTAEDLVTRARDLVTQAGGRFDGDTARGNYRLQIPVGQIEGQYRISGNQVAFEVTKKPMLVPCSAIESYLRGKLGA